MNQSEVKHGKKRRGEAHCDSYTDIREECGLLFFFFFISRSPLPLLPSRPRPPAPLTAYFLTCLFFLSMCIIFFQSLASFRCLCLNLVSLIFFSFLDAFFNLTSSLFCFCSLIYHFFPLC